MEELFSDQLPDKIADFLLGDVCLFLEDAPGLLWLNELLENFTHLDVVFHLDFLLCLLQGTV